MAQYGFGAGTMVTTPYSDAYGVTNATPTPVEMGALQGASVDFNFDLKLLFGRQQFALDAARGKGSIKGKASAARLAQYAFILASRGKSILFSMYSHV